MLSYGILPHSTMAEQSVNIPALLARTEPLRAQGNYREVLDLIDSEIPQGVAAFAASSFVGTTEDALTVSKLARMDVDSSMGMFRGMDTWTESQQYLARAKSSIDTVYPLLRASDNPEEQKQVDQQQIEQLRDRAKYLQILFAVSRNTVFLDEAIGVLTRAIITIGNAARNQEITDATVRTSSAVGAALIERYVLERKVHDRGRLFGDINRGYKFIKDSGEGGADRQRKLASDVMRIAVSEGHIFFGIHAAREYIRAQQIFNIQNGRKKLDNVIGYLRRPQSNKMHERSMRKSFEATPGANIRQFVPLPIME